MFHSNRTTGALRGSVTAILCAAVLSTAAIAAGPRLQTIDVTPAATTISVGQKQAFTATGTFSNGSKHVLGPALSDIAPGQAGTCILLTSGGVECWGVNSSGQLGDGNTADSLIPRQVKGISTATAVALAKDGTHGCALLGSGMIKCWGDNTYGELGDGTNTSSTVPVSVAGINTATALALGQNFSCALLAGGAIQCWGWGYDGELGDGSTRVSNIPVSVAGISTGVAITAGSNHVCAALVSGSVQCWGGNYLGALGNGTTTSSFSPVTVIGINSATAVAAGYQFSCALLASGAVQCWGWDLYGQLGNGSFVRELTTPVSVTGINTANALTAGFEFACAVLRSGSANCWGYNGTGQLGDGTQTNSNIPVSVRAINSPTRLLAGMQHTCALFSGGKMQCWGFGDDGELGNRHPTRSSLPVNVVGTPGVVWTSSDPSKATIGAYGVARGHAVGNTTITATTPGLINDNAVLTVK
jgi:alpha-tubulin suppressor-like RCC1 family protein